MSNLKIISDTNKDEIIKVLEDLGVSAAHFTNGTYAYPAEMIVPTTLAGFEYLIDAVASPIDAIVIAVNSDTSMKGIMEEKNDTSEVEDELARAWKVAEPLAVAHPERDIIVMYYDEATPTPLYEALAESGAIKMCSLHKWGYGTDPSAPKIEGAHNFGQVFGFPLPNDEKPVCYDITTHEDQSDVVKVVKLSQTNAPSGQPYIAPPANKM